MTRGLFIAVEGIDGAGSTTQAKRLCTYLGSLGRKTHLTAEPTTGPLGKNIRDFMKGQELRSESFSPMLALAFAADRLHHYDNEIKGNLEIGIDVVTDRYVLSSLVYQGLDLPQDWVESINRYAPKTDITVLIDAPESVASSRRHQRGAESEIFEQGELQKRVRERYLSLAKSMNAIVIDGSDDVDLVTELLIKNFQWVFLKKTF